MTSLFKRLFGRNKRGSGATAKDRLRFVLQHDRINLPAERAEEMKKEILAVIVKYLAVDQERVEIALEQRDRLHSKLVAELPIVSDSGHPPSQPPKVHAPKPPKTEPNGQAKAEAAEKASDPADSADEDEQAVASAAKSETAAKSEAS